MIREPPGLLHPLSLQACYTPLASRPSRLDTCTCTCMHLQVKIYCEYLEECATHGFEATLCRLTGGGTAAAPLGPHAHAHAHAEHAKYAQHAPPHAPQPQPVRGKAASRRKTTGPAAKPRARWAEGGDEDDLDGFIALDGEGEEAGPVRKRVRARGPARPRARTPAQLVGEMAEDEDEDAPLTMRRKRKSR